MSAVTNKNCVHLKSHANGEVEEIECTQAHSAKALCEGQLSSLRNALYYQVQNT